MITQETKDMTETERLAVRNTNFAYMAELTEKLLLAAHPIGSYYWSANETDPSELFGGTWERIKDRFILAAGDTYSAGSIGGEATVALTEENNGPHLHFYISASLQNTATGSVTYGFISDGGTRASTTSSGKGTPHNNMPPYETAYCWKRTA